MRAYLVSILTVALVSGILNSLSPDTKLGKYIRMISSLAVVMIILYPLARVSGSLLSFADMISGSEYTAYAGDSYEDLVLRQTRSNLEESLKDMLYSRFSIAKASIRADFILDASDIESVSIERIDIGIYPSVSDWLSADISEYIGGIFNCKVYVLEWDGNHG